MVTSKNRNDSGNMLLLILIGIGLFAALAMTITRNNRYDTGSTEQAALNAQLITSYAEKVSGTIQVLMTQNRCLSSQLAFANGSSGLCQVFDQSGTGGGLPYQTPPAAAVDTAAATAAGSALAGSYYYEGNAAVTNAGSSSGDLIFVMPFVTQIVCAQINQITSNSTAIPTVAADAFDGVTYSGAFSTAYTLTTSGTTNSSGCFKSTGTKPGTGYHYYSVLLAN
jgi:hypothetical protein